MSSDFYSNPNRVDIVTGSKDKDAYKTWNEVIAAVLRKERIITTKLRNQTRSTFDKNGKCLKVGCYSNKLCRELKKHDITDIRYGSPCTALLTQGIKTDTYTIYLPNELTNLIRSINDEIAWAAEFETTNPDSSVAEFVSSFGYGEADLDELSNDIYRIYDVSSDISRPDIRDWLESQGLARLAFYCSLLSTGIATADNEIYSRSIGEVAHQLDDDLMEKLENLSDEDRDYVVSHIDAFLFGGCIYINCNYERWAMNLDNPEEFEADVLKWKNQSKPTKYGKLRLVK